jgi:hypothetical protein
MPGEAMWKPKIGWLQAAALAGVLLIAVCFIAPLVVIAWNLTVRAGRGQRLAESLQQKFPALDCHGGASYEGARLFLGIRAETDEKVQKEIVDWLEHQRVLRGLNESLHVTFLGQHEHVQYQYWGGDWKKHDGDKWQKFP